MPHPAKKSKTTKAAKRTSRVLKRIKDKKEFEHLQYLQSQLDENGVPIDILNTDHELLNKEQKLIAGIVKMLRYVDLRSIAIYMNEHYNEEDISNIIINYYSNKENKTWADSFFEVTFKCLGIVNLDHFLLDKVLDETEYIIDTVEQTDKPVMTDEIFRNIVNEFTRDSLNLNELISTCLLVYSQNQDYCMIGGKKRRIKRNMKGGYTGVPFFDVFIMAGEAVGSVGTALGAIVAGVVEALPIIIIGFIVLVIGAIYLAIEQNKRDMALKEEARKELLWEQGAEQRKADEIARKKKLADEEAAKKRAIDEKRFIHIALEMGHAGNRQQLIEAGELQEIQENIEKEKNKEIMRLKAEKEAEELRLKQLADRKWWQRLPY